MDNQPPNTGSPSSLGWGEWNRTKSITFEELRTVCADLKKDVDETYEADPLLDIATGYNRALEDILRRVILE